jgi:hypothetical protein
MDLTESSNNCFVCAIHPILFIARFNIFTMRSFCPHSRSSRHQYFLKSGPFSLLAIISVLYFLARSYIRISRFSEMNANEMMTSIVMVTSNLTISLIIILMQFSLNEQIKHSNGILYIIEYQSAFQVNEIVDEIFKRKIYTMVYKYYLPYFTMSVIVVAKSIYNYEDLTVDTILTLIAIFIVLFTVLSIFLIVMLHSEIYLLLFGNCHQEIEKLLTELDENVNTIRRFLKKRLKQLHRFYLSVFANYRMSCALFGSKIVLFWFFGCVIMIVNLYNIVFCIQGQSSFTDEASVIFILSISGAVGAIVVVVKIQQLQNVVRTNYKFLNYTEGAHSKVEIIH